MKKHRFWASVFVMLAISACTIDKDYDLNKEVDLRVTVVPRRDPSDRLLGIRFHRSPCQGDCESAKTSAEENRSLRI